MKKIVLSFVFLFFSLVLIWCWREFDAIENNLINDKIIMIQHKLINWEISKQQAQEMIQNVNNYTIDQISQTEFLEISDTVEKNDFILWLPDRAKELWLREPVWLVLDQESSRISSYDNPDEWFDSVILVYKWEYESSINEAKNIALEANIPLNKEFEKAKEIENQSNIIDQMPQDFKDSMKGVVYSNYDLIDTNLEYIISVSVDVEWTLVIDASNYKQMQQLIKN